MRMQDKNKALLDQAIKVIELYQEKGLSLSLRQVYYQLVTKNIIQNKKAEYKKLLRLLTIARRDGTLSEDCLEDRSRTYHSLPYWPDYKAGIKALHNQFNLDLWDNQATRPVVLIEKDALIGVIEPVCKKWRVDYMSCRGYLSVGALAELKQRAFENTVIFYLGDHDPSGLDAVRALKFNLDLIFPVEHIALTYAQVQSQKIPPNPAKESDNRFKDYARQYGNNSYELDALKPEFIQDLLSDTIQGHLDRDKFRAMQTAEKAEKHRLLSLI